MELLSSISLRLTGDLKEDVKSLLYLMGKEKTFEHVRAVAEMNMKIAEQYKLSKEICELSGYLHDISAIVAPDDMMTYAMKQEWYVDEAERKYPFLLHQRISEVIAREYFAVEDARILSAIKCHTTLKAYPSPYDLALFVADKLAWDQGKPPFYETLITALDQSLEQAALSYMNYIIENEMILYPHIWFKEAIYFLEKEIKNE